MSIETLPSGTMEIFLLQDVSGIGKKNDLLIVGDGFALNYLLPQRMALVATPTVRKRYAEQIRRRAEEKEHERQLQTNAVQALVGKTVVFSRKASKSGKLYAAVSEEQISKALADQHAVAIPADGISIATPIKATGTYSVQVQVGGTQQSLSISVQPLEVAEKKA